MIISIIYFFLVMFLLGLVISKKIHLINLGYGLALFVLISTILKLPVYPWLFLIIAICLTLIQFIRKKINFSFKKPSIYIILVLILTGAFFYVYHKGAFAYPWLEDGDPWHHSMGAFYIAESHTYSIPYYPETYARRVYLEPYPPAYDILMANQYQLNNDMMWTFKFFNVLLISLGLIFAFYFAKEFFKSETYALLAVAGLAMIPCFMSHFIWSQTLAMILIFPAFYALQRQEYLASTLCMSAIILSQPSTAFIFGIFLYLPYLFIRKKALVLLSGFSAFILSFGYWIPTIMKFGFSGFMKGLGWVSGFSTTLTEAGSFGVKYGLFDFLIAKPTGFIDQPIGIGIFLSVCIFISIFFLIDFYKRNSYIPKVFKLTGAWFILTLLGTLGNYFPINFVPHRFWVFFALPAVLLAVYSIHKLTELFKSLKWPIIVIAVILMFWTSGIAKYQLQTSRWTPGDSFGTEPQNPELYNAELEGYLLLSQYVPKGSSIMELCWDEEKVRTFGYYAPPLDEEIMRFRKELRTADEIYSFMKKKNMENLLLTGTCLRFHTPEEMNKLLNDIQLSGKFENIYATKGFFLFKGK